MFFKLLSILLLSCSIYSSEMVWSSTSPSDVSHEEYQQALKEYVAQNYPKEVAAWEEQQTFRTAGLMWQDDADAKTITKKFLDAQKYCNSLQLLGFNDWRLPTKSELQDLYAKKNSLKNVGPGSYWSVVYYRMYSSHVDLVSFYDRYVSYNVGYVNDNGERGNHYVRCVRAGQ